MSDAVDGVSDEFLHLIVSSDSWDKARTVSQPSQGIRQIPAHTAVAIFKAALVSGFLVRNKQDT